MVQRCKILGEVIKKAKLSEVVVLCPPWEMKYFFEINLSCYHCILSLYGEIHSYCILMFGTENFFITIISVAVKEPARLLIWSTWFYRELLCCREAFLSIDQKAKKLYLVTKIRKFNKHGYLVTMEFEKRGRVH